MPDRSDVHLLQVLGRQLREGRRGDAVVAEHRLVLAEPETAQPGRHVRHGPPLRGMGFPSFSAISRDEATTSAARIAASRHRPRFWILCGHRAPPVRYWMPA